MTAPRPGASGLRRTVEQRSAPVLAWLSTRPRLLLPGLVLALLVAGLALPGVTGAALLLLLGALLLWLSYLSWPVLDTGARLLRAAMLTMVAIAVLQHIS